MEIAPDCVAEAARATLTRSTPQEPDRDAHVVYDDVYARYRAAAPAARLGTA